MKKVIIRKQKKTFPYPPLNAKKLAPAKVGGKDYWNNSHTREEIKKDIY